jgi:predicted nucleotide-binding protein
MNKNITKREFKISIINLIYIVLAIGGAIISTIAFGHFFMADINTKSFSKIIISISGVIAGIIFGILLKYVTATRIKAVTFILCSSEDKEIARKINDDLNKYGFKSFLSEDVIFIGDNIHEKINKNIRDSDFIVPVISNKAINSKWVKDEISFAIEHKKKIFPLLIEDVRLPEELSEVKYANIKQDYDESIRILAKSLRANAKALKK